MGIKVTYVDAQGGKAEETSKVVGIKFESPELDDHVSVGLGDLPTETKVEGLLFGLKTAGSNAYNTRFNAAKSEHGAENAISIGWDALLARLEGFREGRWASKGGEGGPRTSDLLEALATYKERHGFEVDDEWRAEQAKKLKDMDKDARKAFEAMLDQKHKEVFVIMSEIQAKRAQDRLNKRREALGETTVDKEAVADL